MSGKKHESKLEEQLPTERRAKTLALERILALINAKKEVDICDQMEAMSIGSDIDLLDSDHTDSDDSYESDLSEASDLSDSDAELNV